MLEIMKKAYLAVVFAFLAVIGVVTFPAFSYVMANRSECGEEYNIIDKALASFDILNARPPGAVPRGERGSSCDTDDYFASVSRSYRPTKQQTLEDVQSYYRAIALQQGWKVVVSSEEFSDGEDCVVKAIEGSQVNLSVWFPPEAKGDYHVSVSTWPC